MNVFSLYQLYVKEETQKLSQIRNTSNQLLSSLSPNYFTTKGDIGMRHMVYSVFDIACVCAQHNQRSLCECSEVLSSIVNTSDSYRNFGEILCTTEISDLFSEFRRNL